MAGLELVGLIPRCLQRLDLNIPLAKPVDRYAIEVLTQSSLLSARTHSETPFIFSRFVTFYIFYLLCLMK